MHAIVLLTALTAASAGYTPATPCANGQCGSASYGAYPTWTYASPTPAPAAAPRVYAPQYTTPAAAPATAWNGYYPTTYPSYYYPQAAPSCATGNCPRR